MTSMTIRDHIGLAVLLLVGIVCTACGRQRTKEEMMEGLSPEMRRALEATDSTPMISAGIDRPAFVPADQAELRDDDEVIGVVVQGRPKAYPLTKMSGLLDHVVNDHAIDAAGQPAAFTVTYCNATECVRVLETADHAPQTSLEIGTMGMLEGELLLFRGDVRFKQEETVEGLQDVPFQRMTWSQWQELHPDTEVYVGRSPDKIPSEDLRDEPTVDPSSP